MARCSRSPSRKVGLIGDSVSGVELGPLPSPLETPYAPSELVGGHRGALHPGPDLGEGGVPRGGGVVAERARTRSRRRCRAGRAGGMVGRLQHPVADLLGGLDPRVDRVGDADEDPLLGAQVLGDQLERPGRGRARWRAGCRSCRRSAGRGRAAARRSRRRRCGWSPEVAAGTGVHADPGALVVGEAGQHLVVERDEVRSTPLGGVELERRAGPR